MAGLQTFGTTLGFNADAWDSNSGPHASVTGGLLIAPFSALEHGLSKGIPAQRLKKIGRAVQCQHLCQHRQWCSQQRLQAAGLSPWLSAPLLACTQ